MTAEHPRFTGLAAILFLLLHGEEHPQAPSSKEFADAADVLRRFVSRWLRSPELVEDVCQEVLVQAFRRIGNFSEKRDPHLHGGWLYQIAWHATVRALKRLKREVAVAGDEVLDSVISPGVAPEDAAFLAEVRDFVRDRSQFSRDEQAALRRCYDDASVCEIAKEEGIRPAGARTRVLRGKQSLRDRFHTRMASASDHSSSIRESA